MDNVSISVTAQEKLRDVFVLTDTNWEQTDESVSLRVQIRPKYYFFEALRYLHVL